jgi:1,4-alpha-glucan branching enzyme
MYAFTENFILPFSHDEVVYGKKSLLGKMPGDHWQQAAGLRALLGFMWAHPGKQLLFMGSEFGQGAEWSDAKSLDWWLLEDPLHSGLQRLTGDLNRAYRDSPALYTLDTSPAGFSWIDANDAGNNTFSFLRWGDEGSVLACVVNFSALPHEGYRLGLPRTGRWAELVNTDSRTYGGSGVGNLGSVVAHAEPWHGQPASARLRVPPLGALWLRYTGEVGPADRPAGDRETAGTGPEPAQPAEHRTPGSAPTAPGG